MYDYVIYKYEDSIIKTYKIKVKGPFIDKYFTNVMSVCSKRSFPNFIIDNINDKEMLLKLLDNEDSRLYLYYDDPTQDIDKLPKGMEYNINLTHRPNLINKVLSRYFPNDVEQLYNVDINTLVYNLCKYPDNKSTTVKEYIDNNTLKERPPFKHYTNVVEDNSIKFNIYSVVKNRIKVDKIEIILPPVFEGNGMKLEDILDTYLNKFLIHHALHACIKDKKSFKPILELSNTMSVDDRWFLISYALHFIRDTTNISDEYRKDILSLVHDYRVITVDEVWSNNILQELLMKSKVNYFSRYINGTSGSKEVTKYFLYKLLHKVFPDNRYYWFKYKESCTLDNTKFISISDDWLSPLIDLNIVNSIDAMKYLVNKLIVDYYNNKDFSNYYTLEDYYKSLI